MSRSARVQQTHKNSHQINSLAQGGLVMTGSRTIRRLLGTCALV
ncbi:MAG: hypothetical protein ACI9U2_001276, partial [Bradymonadia bacterium]